MFKYTLDNKRYHTFNYFLRNKFGCKVFKVPLDAHATCPNKINGGCIFCKDNSKSNITNANNSIKTRNKSTRKGKIKIFNIHLSFLFVYLVVEDRRTNSNGSWPSPIVSV